MVRPGLLVRRRAAHLVGIVMRSRGDRCRAASVQSLGDLKPAADRIRVPQVARTLAVVARLRADHLGHRL
jgi:hypothetical protein